MPREKCSNTDKQFGSTGGALVDDSELGRALASGDTEALKKMGYANLEVAQKKAQELVEDLAQEMTHDFETTLRCRCRFMYCFGGKNIKMPSSSSFRHHFVKHLYFETSQKW